MLREPSSAQPVAIVNRAAKGTTSLTPVAPTAWLALSARRLAQRSQKLKLNVSVSLNRQTGILPTLADRREALCRTLFASMQPPNHKLHHLLSLHITPYYAIRNSFVYSIPRCRTECFKNSCVIRSVHLAVTGHSYSHTSIT